jgi:hypothetical protein
MAVADLSRTQASWVNVGRALWAPNAGMGGQDWMRHACDMENKLQ